MEGLKQIIEEHYQTGAIGYSLYKQLMSEWVKEQSDDFGKAQTVEICGEEAVEKLVTALEEAERRKDDSL